jgi:hypothetical protein
MGFRHLEESSRVVYGLVDVLLRILPGMDDPLTIQPISTGCR